MAELRKGPKVVLALAAVGALGYGAYFAANKAGFFTKSIAPKRTTLADAPTDSRPVASVPFTAPKTGRATVNAPEVRMLIWAWNAQSGLLLANGGAQTTQGSLMEKHGVNLSVTRQDDVAQMQNSLVEFAKELKSGSPQPRNGAHFVAIMGDGAAAFFGSRKDGLNATLAKLGDEYVAEVVGSAGYSRGEDKFMGLPEWKRNPQSAKGGLVAGYLRDGDWNIAIYWLAQNGLKNNPDEKTWDPDALNWVAADTYIDAAQKYVAGYCETRPVVRDGKPTGEKKNVCVNGVVTWTPGDVIVAEQKGGLVSILSTKENRSQMPNTIIGIRKWNRENRSTVEHFLAAIFEAGDQIKANPEALERAAIISDQVYNEKNTGPDYWVKYFRGVTERDRTGLEVELGGSAVNNLADNEQLFGLASGSANLFAATYTTFGDYVVEQYPRLVPNYFPVSDILDTSYVQGAAKLVSTRTEADTARFTQGARIRQEDVTGRRNWTINFRSGSAEFDDTARTTLKKLERELAVNEFYIELHGHTDSDGDDLLNIKLSQARARAVQEYLTGRSSAVFPTERFTQVTGHGEDEPVSDNDTSGGKARNRRVEVVIGSGR